LADHSKMQGWAWRRSVWSRTSAATVARKAASTCVRAKQAAVQSEGRVVVVGGGEGGRGKGGGG
jgi:hypothetical protein